MSEYHYDEQIDEDKERRLLNFGDDYRNFLDSLSESHSSLAGHLLDDRRKRSKRLSKKKLVSVLFRRKWGNGHSRIVRRPLIESNCRSRTLLDRTILVRRTRWTM